MRLLSLLLLGLAAAALLWRYASTALRWAGGLAVILGSLAAWRELAGGPALILYGVAAWLAGQVLWRLQTGQWRSAVLAAVAATLRRHSNDDPGATGSPEPGDPRRCHRPAGRPRRHHPASR